RLEALGRDVLRRRHVLAAGVVDERVDASVTLQHAVDERADLVLLADVAGDRVALPFAERNGLLERLEPAPGHDDGRAAGRELLRGCAAEPGAAARDDHDAAI